MASAPKEAGGLTAGGVATHAWELARRISGRGLEVSILAENVRTLDPYEVQGIRVWGVPTKFRALLEPLLKPGLGTLGGLLRSRSLLRQLGGLVSAPRVLWWAMRAGRMARDEAPQLVHSHYPAWEATHVLTSLGLPLLITLHSLHPVLFEGEAEARRRLLLIRRAVARARALIVVARGLIHQMEELGIEPPPLTRVIENPIDPPRGDPDRARRLLEGWGVPPGARVVLFAGVMTGRKGEELLVEAWREVRGAVLVMLGEGPNFPRVRELIRKWGLEDRIVTPGFLPRDRVADLLSVARLAVLPSRSESCPLFVLEAMAGGVPLVVTPGAVEKAPGLLPGFAGLVVPPEELGPAISRALELSWDRDRIRAHGLSYSWERKLGEYLEIYRAVLEGS